jgi:hypothetical protein
MLELSGVFGGCVSLASSSATRADSAAFSACSAATCAANASIRVSNVAISASFCSCESWERSAGIRRVILWLDSQPRPLSTLSARVLTKPYIKGGVG